MPKSPPEPEFDLKKRLVGAFILIGFGVVILPRLLGSTGTPAEAEPEAALEPALTAKVFVSKITPIGGATPKVTPVVPVPATVKQSAIQGTGTQGDSGSPPVVPEPATPAPARAAVKVVEKTAAVKKTPAKKAPKVAAVETAKREPGWVIWVGTFAKPQNAERVATKLRQNGLSPSTTKVKTGKGEMMRVWVGPYDKRVKAARMRTRVQQVTGEKGLIAAYP